MKAIITGKKQVFIKDKETQKESVVYQFYYNSLKPLKGNKNEICEGVESGSFWTGAIGEDIKINYGYVLDFDVKRNGDKEKKSLTDFDELTAEELQKLINAA